MQKRVEKKEYTFFIDAFILEKIEFEDLSIIVEFG